MENNRTETLYIVSPCYNEEEMLPKSAPVFVSTLDRLICSERISPESRVLLVDDGSTDATRETMKRIREEYPDRVETLFLKYNSGEFRAFLAGMKAAAAKADVIVTIDCDLQDDIEAIDEMLELRVGGDEIVFGCRPSRDSDRPFYRFCAGSFYFLMRAFGSKIIPHSSEFRLMTKNAVVQLLAADKKNLFLHAEIPLLDLPQGKVYYARKARVAGKSSYNYVKLIRLAASAMKEYTFFFETVGLVTAVSGVLVAVLLDRCEKRGRADKG
ncbi:MAG: glycosyltransferase [Clostridia bacterium]|nr:glycosyltransferase [Clostridia bacterium]